MAWKDFELVIEMAFFIIAYERQFAQIYAVSSLDETFGVLLQSCSTQ